MNTPWDPLHRAYFNGEALWTYLTTPFLLAMDGVRVRGDRAVARRRRDVARVARLLLLVRLRRIASFRIFSSVKTRRCAAMTTGVNIAGGWLRRS